MSVRFQPIMRVPMLRTLVDTSTDALRLTVVAGFLLVGALAPATASGQRLPQGALGGVCNPGEFALSSPLLRCGADGLFRYALPEEMPLAPEGGFTARPAWFPPLSQVFNAPNAPACPLTGRVTFTSPIIEAGDLLAIIPQGMMVADHVTPIDHGYIGVRPLATARVNRTEADFVPVRAPADAEVIEVSLLGNNPNSIRVVMAHGCETYSIVMVLNRVSGALAHLQDELLARGSLRPGVRVLAGEEFGRQRDNPLDFSVHDGAAWLSGFVSPFAYTSAETWKPYTVDPWPYFSPDLAALYASQMQRLVEPRWGRIDLDVRGTAAGNWFLDGTLGYSGQLVETVRTATGPLRGGSVAGKRTYAWSHLALVPHWVQPSRWIFSTGWFADEQGDPRQLLIDVEAGQPAPDALTAASGPVLYRLRGWNASTPPVNEAPYPAGYDLVPRDTAGFAAIQVQGDAITVEVFPGSTPPAFTGFSANRRTYRR